MVWDGPTALRRIVLLPLLLFHALAAGRPVYAEGESLTVVALGDSTTAGTPGFRSPVEAPPEGEGDMRSQYAYWILQKHPDWRILNRGVNGECSDEILQRFDRDVAQVHPSAVIILAGVNDLYQGSSVARLKQNLQRLYEQAQISGVHVIACTILPYNGASVEIQHRMAEANAWIQSYSADHGLGFCDTFKVIEDPAHPFRLSSTPDGLHPDVEGYRQMGNAIADVLETWHLERRHDVGEEKVQKSEAEWKKLLTPEQYRVLRQKGTERPFTGTYYHSKEKGVYVCAACGNELFNSDAKFDSGTGWPSYWVPIQPDSVVIREDVSLGMRRTEVLCGRCGGHLGHVFEDGPAPTGMRYCINSAALDLRKESGKAKSP